MVVVRTRDATILGKKKNVCTKVLAFLCLHHFPTNNSQLLILKDLSLHHFPVSADDIATGLGTCLRGAVRVKHCLLKKRCHHRLERLFQGLARIKHAPENDPCESWNGHALTTWGLHLHQFQR